MQGDGQDAFLQPTVEVFDGTVAPGFVFGDEGEVDPDQQCQADEAIERTGMRGQPEEIAVVDLQGVGQSQLLPGSHDKRQHRFHARFWLKFDKNRPIVDVPVDQEEPLSPRSFQVARSDQIQLMSLVAVRHADRRDSCSSWHTVRVETPARFDRLAASTRSIVRNDGNRLVAQTRQLVTDRGGSGQTISLPWTPTSHQAVANIQDRLTHLARPTLWIAFRRMRTIAQPAGSFRLIAVPPFVKPFPAVFQSLTDPTHRIDPPVSNESLFVANSVRETSQHLPKDKLCLSRGYCQRSRGGYLFHLSALIWRLRVSTHVAVSS